MSRLRGGTGFLLTAVRRLATGRRAHPGPWPCDDCGSTVPAGQDWCAAPGCPDPHRVRAAAERRGGQTPAALDKPAPNQEA